MAPRTASADGETRTSRVVGSVDFVRPTLPTSDDDGSDSSLSVVTGVRCSMPFTIKCPTSSFASAADATAQMEAIADGVFGLVEEKLSSFNPSSELNVVNALPRDAPHAMSEPLRDVVLCAKEMVKLTRGAFDPSVAPLLRYYEGMAVRHGSSAAAAPASNGDSGGGGTEEDAAAVDVDVETVRRQRVVVELWRGLMAAGFAADPSDARVSRTVRRLLELSQWSQAFSVGYHHQPVAGDGGEQNGTSDGVEPRGNLWRSVSAAKEANGGSDVSGLVPMIRKKNEDARLDLSGIAKGWAVDRIADRLPSPCYVEWGGDIKVRGVHPAGRPWVVAVPEPPSLEELRDRVRRAKEAGQAGPVYTLADEHGKDEGGSGQQGKGREYLAVLELRDGDAVATSGDYEKVIERNGKLYSHVINPQLGRLLELNQVTLAQAVVVAKSCMVADAIATAAISKEDPSLARAMLDPFRTGYKEPVSDFLLYARAGPRIVRMSVPGVESKADRERRLQRHGPAKVIVVGSGLAGMSSALEAADARASVIILEKEPKTGGNSAKATSGINGWGTDTQAHQGVADEERLFERDTFRSGAGGFTNHSLVRALSSKSAPAIHWLKHRFGVPLTVLSQLGGHSAKRTHRAPPDENGRPVPIGWKITKTLKDAIDTEYAGKIEVRCGQAVTRLLHQVDKDGVKTVTGVEINGTEQLEADAVVLATGGFGCCQAQDGLMGRFRPDLLGCPTTNGAFAQGDGVILGEELGAELVDMDKVQLHPTGFIDPKDPSNATKFLAPEAIRGSGGILVNSEGRRFVNELDLRSVVAAAIKEYCAPYCCDDYMGPPFAWCILSQPAQALFGKEVLSFYKDRLGLFEDCKDVKAVAALVGCNEDTLVDTLRAYKEAADIGTCHQTHKDVFPSALTPESTDLVVARVTPSIHYTMGGLSINAAGEVQERVESSTVGSHRHIRGLFAAGEVTGGVHGGNRLGGNSLLECVVYGRIAGERAATVKHEKEMFPKAMIDDGTETNWVPVVLREVRNTDKKYGVNTREVRFNLHGSLQNSGLDVGQFVALRGEMDGETLMGYFSPITRPTDEGVIGILCRVDSKGGPITRLLEMSRPGCAMHMCAIGGLRLKFEGERISFRGQQIRRIGLLAGGTGIAPMIQIIRAYGQHVRSNPGRIPPGGLNLIYAAEEVGDLAYMKILEDIRSNIPDHFRFYVILNRPPLGWTEGVGFVERQDIVKHIFYPPAVGDLIVMCGPPVFESAMRKTLARLSFEPSQWFSFAADDNVSAHL